MIMARSKKNDKDSVGLGIKLTLICVALLCVCGLVYAILNATGVLARNTTAMTVGDDQISVLEMRQFYYNTKNSFISTYGNILSEYGYDPTSAAFETQPSLFDSSTTWKDYFLTSAEASAKEISVLYQEAKKAGYELTDNDRQTISNYMDSLKTLAQSNGYTEKQYLRLLFGKNVNMTDVETFFTKRTLANSYYNTIIDGFGITQEDVDSYLESHINDYTQFTYYRFNLTYDENSRLAVKAQADEILSKLKTDGSNFDEVTQEYVPAGTTFVPGLNENVDSSTVENLNLDWLLAADRKAGDRTVVEDAENSRWVVLLFMDKHLTEDYTVSVRHILIRTDEGADAAAAEQQAKDILAQWQAGDQTEESFADLAVQYSADGNAADGGLYTGVTQGQMVETFNDWCFDPSRQPGDTGIVQTEYGYHVMYFVENEGVSYNSEIRSTLESDQYNEWLSAATEGYPTTYSRYGLAMI